MMNCRADRSTARLFHKHIHIIQESSIIPLNLVLLIRELLHKFTIFKSIVGRFLLAI